MAIYISARISFIVARECVIDRCAGIIVLCSLYEINVLYAHEKEEMKLYGIMRNNLVGYLIECQITYDL